MDSVAGPAPPVQSSALSAQALPKKNTASQPPPRDIITAAQDPLATSPPRSIVAAQESLERAIAAAPLTPPNQFAAQLSLANAKALHKAVKLTTASHVKNLQPPASCLLSQPSNITAAGQGSTNIQYSRDSQERASTNHIPRQTVPLHGTWQSAASPSLSHNTLPAVQNFLQMAFETVQRSKSTLPNATDHSTRIAAAPAKYPVAPTFAATPLSPQTSIMVPFPSVQKAAVAQSRTEDTSKPQTASLPDKDLFQINQSMTISSETTSVEQTPNTSEIKGLTSQARTAKSQSFMGYTFYNTALQNNPKQTTSPKHVQVANRQIPDGGGPETENSTQNASSNKLLAQISRVANSNSTEKRNHVQSLKGSPVKQNSGRVPQPLKEFVFRGAYGPLVSQAAQGAQGAQGAHGAQNALSKPGAHKNSWRRLRTNVNNDDNLEEIDPRRRALVSGFPAYTKSQDLIRVLSKFGNCQVDSCRNRLAVVTFESETETKRALKSTNDIIIFGEFVEVKPYTNPKHVEDLYKAYKKVISTRKGPDITMPDKIELTGDFYQQLENIQSAIRLTREQAQAVTNLYVDLEKVLRTEWPGCVAIPFGSIPTGLGIKSSDADCYVELPEGLRGAVGGAATFVPRARRLLLQYPNVFSQLVAIPRANTPIVKFRHLPSGFHCDVSAKTPLGAQNSKLIKLLLEHDPRLAPVAVLAKYWAKVHELSGTGRLTNYALTMMLIFYFQQPSVALVPPVERLQRDPNSRFIVDYWNAGFSSRKLPVAANDATLPDILGGFFEFYSKFEFDTLVVCPYLGTAVPKLAFDAPHLLPLEFARYVGNVRDNLASALRNTTPFCVQDPFEQSHNVASAVCPKLAAEIKAYLKFAADAYAADRAGGCRNFLRTILLTRPDVRKERVSPTTHLILIPRVRGHITAPDWRAVLREIVLDTIFDKILQLRLERIEKEEKKEPSRRQSKVDREIYSATATKPVWRRKTMHRYRPARTPQELVERQAAVTQEILVGSAETLLEFELAMCFREEPRRFTLCFTMVNGDMDAFRQFVTFLHAHLLDWFRSLLRPHMAPLSENLNQALVADAAERSAAQADCEIKFEREPPWPPSPPRLLLDPQEVARRMEEATLGSDTESSDSSKKEPH